MSNRPGNNILSESVQVNLILLSSSIFFLLPPSFVGSAVGFDIKYLGVYLGIRKGV